MIRTSTAILVVAAIGAVRIVQAERQARRQLVLHAAELHQAYCRDTAADHLSSGEWGEGLSPEEAAQHIHANRLISFLSAKYRVGLLKDDDLRVQAHASMKRPSVRSYWEQNGSFRQEGAKDRIDRRFNEIMYGVFDHLTRQQKAEA
ncbi:DUF6082 family protein [Streptomyces sp. NPDC047017]|uniref:DUF6082 family protein n=1 Tax=Streptomyces sp. NPDC047017 TaxID=3155024 RepID=UPI0033C9BAAE